MKSSKSGLLIDWRNLFSLIFRSAGKYLRVKEKELFKELANRVFRQTNLATYN